MDLNLIASLDRWFSDRLQGLKCSPETLAYVSGVLAQRRWDKADMSTQSVVLAYRDAALAGDFAGFQRLGDWVLFVDIVYPQHIDRSRELIESLGRKSYYTCHRLMMGRWCLYEELADGLPRIVSGARKLLPSGR